MIKNVAVLGAGAGGQVCSADLSLTGYKVNLFELPDFKENIKPVLERGGIELTDNGRKEFVRLNKVTTDIKEAIEGVDLIIIVVPCYGHEVFANLCAPHLEDGQILCYLGEGSGSLVFVKVTKNLKLKKNILLGETNTLPYGARIIGPGRVRGFRKKGGVIVAAFPAKDTKKLVQVLREFWPYIEPATNVFETILLNFNAIDHVATIVTNVGRVEGTTDLMRLWGEGATPSVARVIEAVDKEVLAIRETLNFKDLTPYKDWLFKQGFLDHPLPTTYEAIRSSILAETTFQCGPNALQYRYITEDVPYALVLIASIGDLVDVNTPVIDSLITLTSVMNQKNYWKEGRTAEKLGIPTGLSIEELNRFLNEGIS